MPRDRRRAASRRAGERRYARHARALTCICALALLALPLSSLVATPAASAESPAGGLGVNAQEMFWQLPSQYWATNLSEMRADGVRTVRADAFWDHVEPTWPDATGHHYNWTDTDTIARELAQYGLRWLPIADYSAAWAGSYTLNGQLQEHSAPANSDYFIAYATALVARYGPGGTFWSQNPDLTPQPIEGLEVWNEPDRTWAWLPGPDPVAYARLYEATRQAAHAVDPGLQVIIGGIAPSSTTFLEAVYAAVGGAGQIDAVGVHPYATESSQVVTGVATIRAVMDAHGDVNVPIDVTEFGWSTGGPGVPVTDAQRAQRLYEAVTWLAQSDCNVERILPHTWSSPEADPTNVEDWFGIVSPDGTPHLSANALAQTFQTLDQQAIPAHAINSGCGRPLSLALTNAAMTARASSAAKSSRARRANSHRRVARAKRRTRHHRPRPGHHPARKPSATHKPAPAAAQRPAVATPAPAGVTVVAPAAAPARTASQTCVQAVVRSGAFAVAGAVVTFKLSASGRSLASPPPATTDSAGVARACVSVPAGQSELVTASAEDSNFAPVPTAQLAI